jgi:hypothetical protein
MAADPRAPYHGGARFTPAISMFRPGYDELVNYTSTGDTTTNGASHAHPNSVKGQPQREGGKKLAQAAMATTARAHCGSLPFRIL